MMAFKAERPCLVCGGLAEDRERIALGAAGIWARSHLDQYLLQAHNVSDFLKAARGQHGGEQIPCGGLLRLAHLFEPQTGLDEATGAHEVPCSLHLAAEREPRCGAFFRRQERYE